LKDKKRIKTIGKIIGVIVLCIIVIVVIASILPKQEKINNTQTKEIVDLKENNGKIEKEENTLATVPEEEIIEFENPYCTLKYPAIWKSNLKYEESTEDGFFKGTFYFHSSNHEVEMFSIYFGNPELGTVLGYITKDEEKIPFSVDVKEYECDETWTEDEKELLNSMTDGVNEVIVSVTSSEGFIK